MLVYTAHAVAIAGKALANAENTTKDAAMSAVAEWLIYGAYGYSGQLIVRQAVDRGLRPVLGGRDQARLKAMAEPLGLSTRTFAVDEVGALKQGLDGINLVLNCAGPFSATAASMLEGCLQLGAHYLDISGEIEVFRHAHAQDQRARSRGLVVCPGVGFDVVPTDCMAALLKRELADAQRLILAFDAGGGPSPGTAKTAVEGLAGGGWVRRDGQLTRVPSFSRTREIDFGQGPRQTVCVPWGDVYSAFVTTRIPDIEVYMAMPRRLIERVRRVRYGLALLRLPPLQWWLKRRLGGRISGPDEATRSDSPCRLWAEAVASDGRRVSARMVTPNGYDLTAEASIRVAERLLRGAGQEGGYYTPSKLMGADFVRTLDGVQLVLSGASFDSDQ